MIHPKSIRMYHFAIAVSSIGIIGIETTQRPIFSDWKVYLGLRGAAELTCFVARKRWNWTFRLLQDLTRRRIRVSIISQHRPVPVRRCRSKRAQMPRPSPGTSSGRRFESRQRLFRWVIFSQPSCWLQRKVTLVVIRNWQGRHESVVCSLLTIYYKPVYLNSPIDPFDSWDRLAWLLVRLCLCFSVGELNA